jgi:hypothetical protein
MPYGATPSRWCVCQFHHFRIRGLNVIASSYPLQRRPGCGVVPCRMRFNSVPSALLWSNLERTQIILGGKESMQHDTLSEQPA